MRIFLPKLFDFSGDPHHLAYTAQQIISQAQQTPDRVFLYADKQGKMHLQYHQSEHDAKLHLSVYPSINPEWMATGCTYATIAACFYGLGIGMPVNYDQAIQLAGMRNTPCEAIPLYTLFSFAKITGEKIVYQDYFNQYCLNMTPVAEFKNNDILYELALNIRFFFVDPNRMWPFMVEPYDKVQKVSGIDCVILGDVPPTELPRRSDMFAAMFNVLAVMQYLVSTRSQMVSSDYHSCGQSFRRAFHMAESIGAKTEILGNTLELKNASEGTESYTYISAVCDEFISIMEKISSKQADNTPHSLVESSQQKIKEPEKLDISDKKMIEKYFEIVSQSEIRRYRLKEQISSLLSMSNLTAGELEPFCEYTSNYDIYDNPLSEEERIEKNRKAFEKWGMQYKQLQMGEQKNAERKKYLSAAAMQLEEMLSQTEGVLQKLYSYNVVPAKYRTLIASTTICEYFTNGRVDTIKEAINLFEQELRQELVIDSIQNMSDIVTNMYHSVTRNQQMLYNAVCETNASVQRLGNEISALSETYIQNSAQTHVLMKESIAQSEIIARDTAAIRESADWIEMYHYFFSQF